MAKFFLCINDIINEALMLPSLEFGIFDQLLSWLILPDHFTRLGTVLNKKYILFGLIHCTVLKYKVIHWGTDCWQLISNLSYSKKDQLFWIRKDVLQYIVAISVRLYLNSPSLSIPCFFTHMSWQSEVDRDLQ